MNKKGIIIFLVLIVVVVGVVMATRGGDTSTSNETVDSGVTTPTTDVPEGVSKDTYAPVTKESTDSSLLGRLKSASVSASESGARVALVNGTAKFSEGNVKGTITMGDVAVETKVGGVSYVLASLAVNSGGSGTFKYVVLFEDKDGVLTDKSYALVGDRVVVNGVRADVVSGDQVAVSVTYLDHDKGEPLSAAPTIPRTKIFIIESGVFNPAKEISL